MKPNVQISLNKLKQHFLLEKSTEAARRTAFLRKQLALFMDEELPRY